MKHTSELLGRQITLPKRVMILEEFKQSNTVLLHDLLNLEHEGMMIPLTIEISKSVAERRLGTSCVSVDHVLEAVCITKEISVPDRIVLIAINKGNSVDLGFVDLEAKSVQHLSEDLWAHLEVSQRVPILKEALCIKSVLSNNFSEVLNDLLAQFSLISFGLAPTVDSVDADLANGHVKVFLEAFRGEDFVDFVGELFPFDVFSFLGRLEHAFKHFKFASRDRAFGHI